MVTSVTKDNFQKEVMEFAGKVMVDFYADWCGPCKMTAPILDALANEFQDKMKFVKVNIDENQELAGQFSVSSIPTFMIFNKGQVISQFVGAVGRDGFLREINQALVK